MAYMIKPQVVHNHSTPIRLRKFGRDMASDIEINFREILLNKKRFNTQLLCLLLTTAQLASYVGGKH